MATKEENIQIISQRLLEYLYSLIKDTAFVDALRPIIPPMVRLALAQGEESAREILIKITSADSYGAWKSIIEFASYDERIVLLEETTKLAIEAKLRKIEKEKALWELLQAGLRLAFSLVPLLLA